MKIWTQVIAHLPSIPDDWSIWAERFGRFGIQGTVQTDEPPTISGYVCEEMKVDVSALSDELRSLGAAKVSTIEVSDEDWAESWKQFFRPHKIGDRLTVCPSWETYAAEGDEIVLVLDPGQAFGTGDHASTRMCLEIMQRMEIADRSVADIGCGSGILSVFAMQTGAAKVDAVDIDPVSVAATRENALKNGVAVTVYEGDGFSPLPDAGYEVVLANIISEALIHLAPEAKQRVSAGGHWLVSGIIAENWPDVERSATVHGFELVEVERDGEWVAALFRRLPD
ncbi:MAG: 50S ribosomal protein L11 methyltransferase [Armatimonadetes bacterium]|nr:50S ribosomal protein L11 methyltransferase [Armatimonadota bacterium]